MFGYVIHPRLSYVYIYVLELENCAMWSKISDEIINIY